MLRLVVIAFIVALGPVCVAALAKVLHWSVDRTVSSFIDLVSVRLRKFGRGSSANSLGLFERANGIGIGLGSAALYLADAEVLLAAL